MIKEQFKQNFKAFLIKNDPLGEIEELFIQALESGVLNYGNEEENSYRTAKIVYYAILCKMTEEWRPLADENREESEILKLKLK